MEKKTYPSGVITPELGSTNWYSDYDTNSSLLDSNITKTNSLDSKVKELETSYTNVETSLTSLSAVAKSGDYNDLSNKPESIALAEKAVADGDNNVITKTYATKKEVATSLEPYIKKTELADVATSGSYADLSDKPTTIAHADRATADNNGDVITETYAKKTEIPNLDGYALSKDISKVGKTNNYKDLDNLPTIPSLDGYVTNVELSPVAKSGDYNDLSNTPEPVDLTPYATKTELNTKANDADVVHKSGTETIVGTKTFSSQIKGNISGTSSNVVVGSDTATARGYLVDNNLPWYTWEEGSQLIAGRVPLITDFNNLIKPGVYHVVFCLNDGFVHEEKEYKESLNRPSIPGPTTGFRDAILEIKKTSTMYNISAYNRLTQKITLLSGSSASSYTDLTYQRVCLNPSTNVWTAWKRVARDEEVVHTSGDETINGVKTFSNDVNISKITPYYNVFSTGYIKGQAPTSNIYSGVRFYDDINSGSTNGITGSFEIEYNKDGYNRVFISSRNYVEKTQKLYHVGLRVPNDNTRSIDFLPSVNGVVNLGASSYKWKAVYANSVVVNDKNVLTDANQIMLCKNLTGANIDIDGVVDCGDGNGKLGACYVGETGEWIVANTKPTGKWKNTSMILVLVNAISVFVKVG